MKFAGYQLRRINAALKPDSSGAAHSPASGALRRRHRRAPPVSAVSTKWEFAIGPSTASVLMPASAEPWPWSILI